MIRICSLLLALLATPLAADPRGPIHVIDGDTFDIGGTRVRLHGVDAPEQAQLCGEGTAQVWSCGAWVTQEVRARYEGRAARCTALGQDGYGRTLARCDVDGADLGRTLVSDGLAFAFRRYSMEYDLDEKRAVVALRGLHREEIDRPSDYRAGMRQAQAVANSAGAPEDCAIKGNISRKGERIFHAPGQEHYGATQISTAKGERWFCTEAEARAAGWRKARR